MDQAPLLRSVSEAAASGDSARALALSIEALGADTGTLHYLGADGQLHLAATGGGIPPVVAEKIRVIPVGKGMAGLAVERAAPPVSLVEPPGR